MSKMIRMIKWLRKLMYLWRLNLRCNQMRFRIMNSQLRRLKKMSKKWKRKRKWSKSSMFENQLQRKKNILKLLKISFKFSMNFWTEVIGNKSIKKKVSKCLEERTIKDFLKLKRLLTLKSLLRKSFDIWLIIPTFDS